MAAEFWRDGCGVSMNGGGVSARQLWSFDERRRSSDETAAEFG
jgi:hypothetical protein